jgi:hypothetical protein
MPPQVAWWRPLFLIALMPVGVLGNTEGDALYALRQSLTDSSNVLQSWDPTLVNPCTWFHVTCNAENSVTRLYVHFVLRLFAAIVTLTALYLPHSLTGLNSHVSLRVSTWRTCIA